MTNYNLLKEAWIPVLWKDGRASRVGVLKALEQTHQIRQIAASNPMDRLAILRFLLALLYWCQGNPPDGRDSISSFPSDWFKRLDDNRDCFNLLGDGERFYQDRAAKRTRPATVLIQEVPAGNNFWHLRHSTDNKSGLCSACCAMGLVRLPLFALSGLSGPGEPNLMAGINGVPPIYVAAWRKSLHGTLLANWTISTNIGEPLWARRVESKNFDTEVPLLIGLTLLPRRVFLHDPIELGELCVGCGRELPLIVSCEYQTAGKQESDKWNDPHTLYLDAQPRKTMRAADLTASGRFRMDRPWPDLAARLLETGKSTPLLIVGFATNKAKNIDVWERMIDVPRASETASAEIGSWQLGGRGLEKRMEKIGRSEILGSSVISAVRPQVEANVAEKLGELIAGSADAWEHAASEYGPMMAVVAKSLSPGFTTAALRRRREIANLKPDMRQRGAAKKTGGKKGGGS